MLAPPADEDATGSMTRIHVLAEDGVAGPAIARILTAHGMPVELHRLGSAVDWPTIEAGDIPVLIVNDSVAATLSRIHPEALARFAKRTVAFLPRLDAVSVFALERAGINYVTTAGQKIESLFFLISRIDPDCLRRAAEMRQYREVAATNIYLSTVNLFDGLRKELTEIRHEVSEATEKSLAGLLRVTPMACWLDMIETYHDGTAQHCSLVSGIALRFANHLRFSPRDRSRVFDSAFFHDIGKVRIPLAILDKPGLLTDDERLVMKTHTRLGYEMLVQTTDMAGEIASAALNHHEYLDGTGYPSGLRAKSIDDTTRILTICDIFAAMIEKRPYKEPRSPEEAYSALIDMDGKLDQDLVRVFEDVATECAGLDGAAVRRMRARVER
jgi:putative nucleotidyltransferase with HDIG domain